MTLLALLIVSFLPVLQCLHGMRSAVGSTAAHMNTGRVYGRHPSFTEAYTGMFKEPPESMSEVGDDFLDCPTGIQGINHERILSLAKKGPVRHIGAPQSSSQEVLFIIAAPFTGSTALLSLISTSPEVSNLCPSKSWACEGAELLRGAHLMSWESRWQPNYPSNWSSALEVYKSVWNTSKMVLVDKSPPNIVKMQRIDADLRRVGVIPKFLVLTKNPCSLSEEYLPKLFDPLIESLETFEPGQVHQIKYEDLVREPHNVAREILNWIPSLKSLDPGRCGVCNAGTGVVAWAGRNMSIVEYVTSHSDFDFLFYAVSTSWKTYMQTFGYV